MMFYIEVLLAVGLVVFLYANKYDTATSIFGIYREENRRFYFVKYLIALLYLKYKRADRRKIAKQNDKVAADKTYDTFSLVGTSSGQFVFSCRLKSCPDLTVGHLSLKVPEFDNDILTKPLTARDAVFDDDVLDIARINVDGLEINLVVPPKMSTAQYSWTICYKGVMHSTKNPGKEYEVKFHGTWSSRLPLFSYNDDVSFHSLARAVANHHWNRDYARNLKLLNQVFKEQHGEITGVVEISGTPYKFACNSLKKRIFGPYEYQRNIHRYVMHYITLDTGDRISVGVACIPLIFTNVQFGFVCRVKSAHNYPVTYCDLKLYRHGEQGQPPQDYCFFFKTAQKEYWVKVYNKENQRIRYTEDFGEKIFDYCSSFEVNGIPGWGLVEWHYKKI